jgi:phosphoserine phosphatase
MTLVAFDFDGTLSDSEMTVLLGDQNGSAGEMAEITERAMNDEIGYATSLRERAALLEGLPEPAAERAYGQVELREGAGALIEALRAAGHHVAILTGGFERGVERALERESVGVDTVIANRLPVESASADASETATPERAATAANGEPGDASPSRSLTGAVEGPLIEGTKDDALARLAEELGTTAGASVAVGDGANDLPMLEVAGLAVGYDPKPAVEPVCDAVVTSMADLRDLLAERGLL